MGAQLAAAVLGLSLTCIDTHLTRKAGEREFWKSLVKLIYSPVHLLYILSRYFAIIAQICNIVIASIWKYQGSTTIPHHICYMHLIFITIVCQFSFLILDTVLMLRVYALYNKSREIIFFLGLALLLKSISAVLMSIRLQHIRARPNSIHFNHVCTPTARIHEASETAVFVFGEIAIHCALCWLTLAKTWSFKHFWPHASTRALAYVLNRDALSVFVVVFGTFAAVTIGTYGRQLAIIFAFPILISITSCASCRLILHLHKLGMRETSADPEDMTLTTIDAITSSTWDTQTNHE